MASCPNCGQPLKSGWNFCPYCIANVGGVAPRSGAKRASGVAYKQPRKKSGRIWLVVTLVAFFVLIVPCGFYLNSISIAGRQSMSQQPDGPLSFHDSAATVGAAQATYQAESPNQRATADAQMVEDAHSHDPVRNGAIVVVGLLTVGLAVVFSALIILRLRKKLGPNLQQHAHGSASFANQADTARFSATMSSNSEDQRWWEAQRLREVQIQERNKEEQKKEALRQQQSSDRLREIQREEALRQQRLDDERLREVQRQEAQRAEERRQEENRRQGY